MLGANLDITVVCGRDFYLSITNQTAAGNPFSLVGYATVMTVKAYINDPDNKALYQAGPWSSNLPFGATQLQNPAYDDQTVVGRSSVRKRGD